MQKLPDLEKTQAFHNNKRKKIIVKKFAQDNQIKITEGKECKFLEQEKLHAVYTL